MVLAMRRNLNDEKSEFDSTDRLRLDLPVARFTHRVSTMVPGDSENEVTFVWVPKIALNRLFYILVRNMSRLGVSDHNWLTFQTNTCQRNDPDNNTCGSASRRRINGIN